MQRKRYKKYNNESFIVRSFFFRLFSLWIIIIITIQMWMCVFSFQLLFKIHTLHHKVNNTSCFE